MSETNTKKVIILTGPGGSGKSTVASLLVKHCGFVLVDGDRLDTEFFPDGDQWLPENSDKLEKAHDKILHNAKELFEQGNNVVVDYIIFGHYLEFLEKFRQEFGDNLIIRVLFPSQDEMVKRDADRKSWTTGVDRITAVRKEFEGIKGIIGSDKFIDTSGQSPEETFEKYFRVYCPAA